ncbi:MAG: CotH kinase family protein [Bacteroidetes bacterium]|nr:CotH kinase family protein [Bacteroidota bacterium]
MIPMRWFTGLLLLVNLSGYAALVPFNGSTGSIPNNNTWKLFPCNVTGLQQPGLSTSYGLLELKLSIAHNNVSDLEIHLVSPNGTDVLICDGVGGSGNNFTNTAFRQSFSTPIASGTAPFSGNYLPQGNLNLLNNGQNGNGNWNLRIRDKLTSAFSGSLTSWQITFTDTSAVAPSNVFSTNLPIIRINTFGQAIPDDPKIPVDFQVIDNGYGQLNYDTNTVFSFQHRIGIELRGSSSQWAPKVPYGFETWDALNNDVDTSFLGFPSQSDWILSPSYYDKTLMRNVLSYDIFNKMGHYATRTKYCELFLNGDYQGIYIVMEKIKRDEERVDIAKLTAADTIGDQLTGGYIYKIDKFTGSGGDGFYSAFPPSNPTGDAIYYQYEYPSQLELQPQQADYLERYVDSFETALFGPDFADPEYGFRRYASEQSFIDYMLLNEMSKNVDGYRLSTYFHKDKQSKGGKIKAGPAWDFDITWKNADYCQAEIDTGWAYNLNYVCSGAAVPAHWERMLQDTLFRARVKCRWNALSSQFLHTDSLFAYIDSTASWIDSAQQRNFVKWPILGVPTWPEPQPLPQTYAAQIQRLKSWITTRFAWMDAQFNQYPNVTPIVSLGNDTSVCGPGAIGLTPGNFETYSWSTGQSSPAILTSQSGIYRVSVSDKFGCSASDEVNITFWDLPSAAFTSMVTADTVQFAATDTAVLLLWNFGDGTTGSVSAPLHTYATSGTYYVSLQATDSNGCVSASIDSVTILPSDIAKLSTQIFSLYPNPVSDVLHVTNLSGAQYDYSIYDALGQFLEGNSAHTLNHSIDIMPYSPGVYWLQLKTSNTKLVKYFIKR